MENVLFLFTLFLSICYAAFIFWCIVGWKRLVKFQTTPQLDLQKVYVSVIIPARNEAENISDCLSDFLHQDYPFDSFELIVADDHSEDNSAAIVERFILENPSLSIRLLKMNEREKMILFKKHAITESIAMSSGELIITTDADCRRGPEWLSTLVQYYRQFKPEMMSAPVIFSNEKSWFEKMQSLEFLGLIAIGAAAIKNNKPFLCNGANLAFTKEAFIRVGGYHSAKNISSGDDTQLMKKIAVSNKEDGVAPDKKEAIHFVRSVEAVVTTSAHHSLHALLNQRKRWASKIPVQMSAFTIFIAIIAYLFHAGLLISGILMCITGNILFFLIPLIIKMIPEFILLYGVSSFFKKTSLLFLFLPAQIIYPVYISIVGLISMSGDYQWKGRRVK